jgi:signal peptidase I
MKSKYLLVLLIVFISFLNLNCFKLVRVDGIAMKPALNDGDRLILNTNVEELKRGEIISFLYPKDNSKFFIKRIVGLPNETLEIREGKVFIDGNVLDEPYILEEFNQSKSNFPPRKIKNNNFFVIGDNRDNSSDSRYWGTVSKDLIIGTYTMKY